MTMYGAQARFELVTGQETDEHRKAADLGTLEHVGVPSKGRCPRIQARTILCTWRHRQARTGPRPSAPSRAKRAREGVAPKWVVTPEVWFTNLEAEDLPVWAAVDIYNQRQTIEAYFKDEQQALGARHVRSRAFAGLAGFQWMVAITSNTLRWLQADAFAGTVLEEFGLTRLVKEAMAIPGQIRRDGPCLLVTLDSRHPLVRRLNASWTPLLRSRGLANAAMSFIPIAAIPLNFLQLRQ
jgi:hypothetical protein